MSHLGVLTVTFNCGRERVKPSIFARHLLSAVDKSEPPDLIILCLQEIAPVSYSFLGGSYLLPYYHSLRHAVHLAAASLEGARYINVVVRNVGMTAIMAFALEEQVGRIKRVRTAGVGVGMREMGNKGAVGLRFGYTVGTGRRAVTAGERKRDENENGEEEGMMEISVVAAHLAPMEYAVDRRNEDWKSVVQRLVFTSDDQKNDAPASPSKPKERRLVDDDDGDGEENAPLLATGDPSISTSASITTPTAPNASLSTSGLFTPTSHLIFAGDLNYRTADQKPTPSDFHLFPQSTPPEDSSHPKHYSSLLKNDQLRREMKAGRTCHGLHEAPIDFPPTYKYSDSQRALVDKYFEEGNDIDADQSRSQNHQTESIDTIWAPHRWPSWCDRILYLDLPPWMTPSSSSTSPFSSTSTSTSQNIEIKVKRYTSLPLMSTSDHRPVLLSLSIPLKAIPPPPPPPPPPPSGPLAGSLPKPDEISSKSNPYYNEDVRIHLPFGIDPEWKAKRARARRLELAVGLMMFLTMTGEGNLILLGMVVVGVGVGWIGWWLLRG
jgi:hypothetical protein